MCAGRRSGKPKERRWRPDSDEMSGFCITARAIKEMLAIDLSITFQPVQHRTSQGVKGDWMAFLLNCERLRQNSPLRKRLVAAQSINASPSPRNPCFSPHPIHVDFRPACGVRFPCCRGQFSAVMGRSFCGSNSLAVYANTDTAQPADLAIYCALKLQRVDM